MNFPPSEVAQIRARFRESLGEMSQTRLADIIGISDSNISRYLRDRDPSLKFIMKVCKALDISSDWLLFGIGEMRRGEVSLSRVSSERLVGELADRIRPMARLLDQLPVHQRP